MLAIGDDELAYKRMPMFADEDEIAAYAAAFDNIPSPSPGCGFELTPSELIPFRQRRGSRRVVYLAERTLPAHAIGNQVVRRSAAAEALRLLEAVLGELTKFTLTTVSRRAPGLWASMGRSPIGW